MHVLFWLREWGSGGAYCVALNETRHFLLLVPQAAMGYVRQWDDFAEAAQQLFREHPNTVRYSVKYRHCDGKLLLKVTNNQQVSRSPPLRPPPSFLVGANVFCSPDM
jgi:hypothetical protein